MAIGSDARRADDPLPSGDTGLQPLLPTERQITRLRRLQEISCKLNSTLDLEEALATLLDEAIQALGAERGCLLLKDDATGELELRLSRGLRSCDLTSESFQLSQTVIQRVWSNGKAVLTANAAEDPELGKADSVVKYTLRSILCVPLRRQAQTTGVLYLDNRVKAGQFQEDDLAYAVAIADQAAIALHNAQLYAEAQQRLAEMQSVLAIARALVSEISLDNLLEFIMVQAEHLTLAKGAAVLLLSDDRQWLEVARPGQTWLHVKTGSRFPVEGSLAGLAVASQQVQVSNCAQEDERAASACVLLQPIQVRSLLCAPLVFKGESLGALLVWNKPEPAFTRQDSRLMGLFADQAALALYNAQLYRVVQQELAERVRAEAALRESEERYRSFAQNFQGIAFRGDLSFTPLFFHGAVKEITGYTEDEFIAGKPSWDQVIHPEDWDKISESVEKIHSTPGYATQREYRIVRKDGQIRWVQEFIQNTCDDFGRLAFVQGAIYDITERVQSQERLRLLSSALEQSSEGIAMCDLEGNLWFVNKAFAALHSYDPEELVGQHLAIFHTPEQMPSVEVANRQLLETGEFSGEIWHKRRDGVLFPTLMHNSLLHDEWGKPVGMIGTLRDITERKRAEEEIRRRNRELELLYQANQAFTLSLDLNQVLVSVLEGIRHLLDVSGVSIWLVDPETDQVVCRQASGPGSDIVRGQRMGLGEGLVGRVASSGESLIVADAQADERFIFRGLTERIGLELRSLLCAPLRTQRGVIGAIYIVDSQHNRFGSTDLRWVEALAVTAANAIENAQLYAQVRQLAAEQERQRLARKLHDTLSQSLYSIGMAAQTSLKRLRQADVEKALAPLEHVLALSQSALTEMREQLHELHPTILSDKGLIEALAQHCDLLRTRYLLSIAFVANGEPSLSMIQREYLYYIAREALLNVVKHAGATRVTVTLRLERNQVVLSVKDDGSGFDPTVLGGEETVGLRNMRERAELLGGSFELQSEAGQAGTRTGPGGTQVTVRIPL